MPAARRSAVNAVDAMLQALHAIRARLISEIRASDDASAARADALLARGREGGQRVTRKRRRGS